MKKINKKKDRDRATEWCKKANKSIFKCIAQQNTHNGLVFGGIQVFVMCYDLINQNHHTYANMVRRNRIAAILKIHQLL